MAQNPTLNLVRASIGFLMAFGTYYAARRRKTGAGRARTEFPALAARLGLAHRPPADSRGIGSLRGTYEGHEVFVDPDDRPRVVVYLRGEPQILFRSFIVEKRTPANWVRIESGDSWLDGYLKDRYASTDAARALRPHHPELAVKIRRIVDGHLAQNPQLSVTAERIECALDFGKPAHLPADAVERLLPDLEELAELLEEAAGARPEMTSSEASP
ncbi:MAG TPA: hypothetical protein VHE30_20665 [Polyangiaceae bacterium]|nr:hypothetical protein [Polyangiaceae bacterium]